MKVLLLTFTLLFGLGLQAQDNTLSLYFDLNSSKLSSVEADKLQDFIDSEHGEVISVTGYCDTVGSIVYNNRLAQQRLVAVTRKIDHANAELMIDGETEASQSNNYDANKSRRVDIIYKTETTNKLETRTPGAIILEKKFNEFIASDEKTVTFDLSLLFIPGYPVLIKESIPEIRELFDLLDANTNVDAHIHGHVCCADDYKLSLDRAIMVRDYLTTLGIDIKRLEFTAHSNKKPRVSPEVTESDRLMNRRVTVDFTKK